MLVDRYLKKELMVDEFITHNMGLDKINEGFDLMHAGKRWAYFECGISTSEHDLGFPIMILGIMVVTKTAKII